MGHEQSFRESEESTHKERIEALVAEITKLLGDQKVAVLDPSKHAGDPQKELKQAEAEAPKKAALKSIPPCQLQPSPPKNLEGMNKDSDALNLWLGTRGRIPRWKKGSEINFAAYSGGYPHTDDAIYAARQLNRAALYWNSLNVGVTFKWVGSLADAEFVLGYGGLQGDVVASAFWPSSNDLDDMIIYKRAFDSDVKPVQWRFFLHELGHVLGLRHEFADVEGGAVQWAERDPLSVMNYREEAPMITELDIVNTKAFYDYNEPKISGVPLVLFVPDN